MSQHPSQSASPFNRRSFLSGMTTAGLLTLAGLGIDGGEAQAISSRDRSILNFALNLEYLEAEFYLAATGQAALGPDDTTGEGAEGETTGRIATTFTDALLQNTANEITADEVAHVRLLRAVLGRKAVAKPAIDLDPLGSYATQAAFLTYARAFEDAGVSAYGGAARFLQKAAIVEAAARILATEAYHAGNIRLFSVQQSAPQVELDALDQEPTPTNLFPTDENGLSIIRTTDQVLEIVAPFFPNGLNGKIR